MCIYIMIKEDYVWCLLFVKFNVNEFVMSLCRGCKVYYSCYYINMYLVVKIEEVFNSWLFGLVIDC